MKVRIYRNYHTNSHNYFQEVDSDSLKVKFDPERYPEFIKEAIDTIDINAPKEAWARDDLDIAGYSYSPVNELKRDEVDDIHHIRINLNMGSGKDITVHPEWNPTMSFFGNIMSINLNDTEWDSPCIVSPKGHWVEVSYVTKNK